MTMRPLVVSMTIAFALSRPAGRAIEGTATFRPFREQATFRLFWEQATFRLFWEQATFRLFWEIGPF